MQASITSARKLLSLIAVLSAGGSHMQQNALRASRPFTSRQPTARVARIQRESVQCVASRFWILQTTSNPMHDSHTGKLCHHTPMIRWGSKTCFCALLLESEALVIQLLNAQNLLWHKKHLQHCRQVQPVCCSRRRSKSRIHLTDALLRCQGHLLPA